VYHISHNFADGFNSNIYQIMKKILLFVLGAFLFSTKLTAWEQIPFTVNGDIDIMPIGHGYGKSPMRPPVVYIEDYTLTFAVDHPDYVLTIKDEDGVTVYSTTVFSAQTEVILPSTLSGDYEIQLVMGNWLFTGWINL
jgi:hypothetical protein